ncbi:MAG: response regulator [Patescibacteria group bacterium]
MTESPLVLIVDDEQNFRDIISAVLGASGFRIATAANGEEALARVEESKPDLILLDMKMPVMDGATMLTRLKEKEGLKDIKVLFLSSFGDAREGAHNADQHFAKEMGAIDYINKTEIDTQLIPKIKALFG